MTKTKIGLTKSLDASCIQEHIAVGCFYKLYVLQTVTSTNDFLRDVNVGPSPTTPIAICCAEEQTAGRGSKDRSWSSPFGQNIYCSIKYSLPPNQDISGLSLVISLAVSKTIKLLMPDVSLQVKWPNDVLWQGLKLCGNLLEVQGNQLIIGIGINVNEQTDAKNPWCSLATVSKKNFDRNIIIGNLISIVYNYVQKFLGLGFMGFLNEWQELDYLIGKNVQIKFNNGKELSGIVTGVNHLGGLKVQDSFGVEQIVFAYSSLQVS